MAALIPSQWRAVAEALALAPLIFMGVITIQAWPDLPEHIATHFGANGRPDRFGPRGSIWLLPAAHFFVWLLITVVQQFPQVWNHPFPLTDENREDQIRNGLWMLLILKILLGITFAWIQWGSIQASLGQAPGLSPGLLPAMLVATFASLAFFFWRAYQLK
jgi:uncharacterized membrane protein